MLSDTLPDSDIPENLPLEEDEETEEVFRGDLSDIAGILQNIGENHFKTWASFSAVKE